MRAMHKGMHRAFSDSSHNVHATIEAVHSLSNDMPAHKCVVVGKLLAWLRQRAHWRRELYTSLGAVQGGGPTRLQHNVQ